MYVASGGQMKLKDIATRLEIPDSRVRKWKAEDHWDEKIKKRFDSAKGTFLLDKGSEKEQPVPKKPGAPKGNQNAKGHGAPKGNKNALGNKGGAPMGNANALTHGLYAKYLPAETLEIAKNIVAISPLDILWGNISIQYAAIIRAQKVMEVESKDELIKHVKSDGINATTYEFQFAWDRQATFMAAQSKAMTTLNNMIKQYDELCKSELATEGQRLRIEKLKSDMEINKERLMLERQKLQPPTPDDLPDDGFIDALKAETSVIWSNDGDKDD